VKVIVTGAGGLIGGALVNRLAAAHEVHAISRSAAGLPRAGVHSITADLSAPALPDDLPAADAVVHLAQSSHYREFPERALDVFNVNVASTARLLDWSRRAGVRHFILASTGTADTVRSYYSASKHSAEQFAHSYATEFTVLVLRMHFVYGPAQRRSMLVPRLIDQIRNSQAIPLAGRDGAVLNPTYVNDAVTAIEAALARRVAGTIRIAGPEVLSIRTMAEAIASALGTTATFAVEATQQPQDFTGDITEMSERLGAPKWSFASGIAEMMR